MQRVVGIDPENGADGVGRQRLGPAAQQVSHGNERLTAGNGLQYFRLETQ
jgi:hypothetical protein